MISFSQTQRAWSQRSFLEKSLLQAVVFLTVLVICLIIAVVLVPRNKKKDGNWCICKTKACEALGTHLEGSMDLRQDPCEDFYTYSCGGWLKNHDIPSGYRQYGAMEIISQDVLEKLNGLLSEERTSTNSSAVENALMYFSSCMNTSAIESRGVFPMHSLLSEIGGWPVVNGTWAENTFDWVSAVAKIQFQTSFGFIMLLTVGPDPQNTSSNILQLERPSISLMRETLLYPETNTSQRELKGYRNFFKSVALLLGAEKGRLDEDFEGMINFETKLVKMMKPEEEMRYKKLTVEELSAKIPEFNWTRYLQMVTNSTLLKFGEAAVINKADKIIVRDMDYIQNVSKYMNDLKIKRQIANYIGWRTIMTRMRYLPSEFNEALQNYSRDTGLPNTAPDRRTLCTNVVKSSFKNVASFLFINRYFHRETKHQVDFLAMLVKNTFGDTFDDSPWMDYKTKTAAKSKLEAMNWNIGYPEWVRTAQEIDKLYNETEMPQMTDNAFEDELALIQHATMQAIATLRRRSKRQEWSMSPVTVNAAYNPNKNEITVPAAFLQFPMLAFDPSVPPYYNYATIGTLVAHEMTHGFDSEGRLRNGTGEIQNWWSPQTEQYFNQSAQCFIDQYNAYKVNGKATLAENIADNVGLRQAYKAFRAIKNSTERAMLHLPGFDKFSPEQLFFISYASIWCTKYQPEFLEYKLRTDKHSPAEFRVQGPLSNMKEFAEAFGCKSGASYNREKRCIIWR